MQTITNLDDRRDILSSEVGHVFKMFTDRAIELSDKYDANLVDDIMLQASSHLLCICVCKISHDQHALNRNTEIMIDLLKTQIQDIAQKLLDNGPAKGNSSGNKRRAKRANSRKVDH